MNHLRRNYTNRGLSELMLNKDFDLNSYRFKTEEMNEEYAKAISGWQYKDSFKAYSFDNDKDELEQVLNGLHFAVVDEISGELCGFLCIGWSAQVKCRSSNAFYLDESYTDLGLGLRPELVGKGLGADFIKEGIRFVKELFPEDDGVRLTVAEDNKIALVVYKKMGFVEKHKFNKGLFNKKKYIILEINT